MQMIQHSSIPITSPLQSTSPQENYSSSDSDSRLGQDPDMHPSTSSPSAASSSSSHRPPTAGAGRIQGSKPFEQELNSLGSIANSPRTSNKRAKRDQVDQDEEEDDSQDPSALSISEEDARRVFREEEEEAGQIPDASAPSETAGPKNPVTLPAKSAEPLQNPGRIHSEPSQILSPTGYILGFLPSSSRNPAETPASSSSASAQQAQTQLSPISDSDGEHRLMPPDSPESSSASTRRREEEEEEKQITEGNEEEEEQGSSAAHARSAAVRLLLGFMGALQASQFAVNSFVNNVVQYYRYTSQTAIMII